jgi:CDP-diacylglycerol--glycerol-3-phosphate 3-phosphatidyltransferase
MVIDGLKRWFDSLPLSPAERKIFNLPNVLTMLRIAIVPVLFFLLVSPGETGSLILAGLFVLASLTDILDGWVARRYGIVTTMGKFLDPIADKLVVNTAMILMIPIGRIPAWVAAIIVIRDFIVDGIRSIASADGIVIAASPLGKQKTVCQAFAVTALIIHYPFFGADAHLVGTVLVYLALVLTVWSGLDYLLKFYRFAIRKDMESE